MVNEIVSRAQDIFDIAVNVQGEIKLEGWPASLAIITLSLSGVALYGIKEWGQAKRANNLSDVS